MRSLLALVVLVVLAVGTVGGAGAAEPDSVVSFDAERAMVYARGADAPLLRGSGAPAADVVRAFLRAQGRSAATVASLRVEASFVHRGVTHLRLGQSVGGLRVSGAHVRAAFDARGDLIHLIDNSVDVLGGPAAGLVTADQALDAALARVHPDVAERPAAVGRQGTVTSFARTPFFHVGPRAERVLVARQSGALEVGFVVETWSRAANLLNHTLVDRAGRAAAVELRTANDSYNVFPEDPGKDVQTVVAGPGAGNTESPGGWLTGSQLTTNIGGNNVRAYLDRDANNTPDAGGTSVTDGNFLAAWNGTVAPTDATNQAVSVQNLFYLNNVLHDTLYRHGFTEATGNFQSDNFGNGGLGGDPVNAEAQDGSGTDNANFATPSDGSSPRMQMFLWTGAGFNHEVAVGASSYNASTADYGPALDTTGATGPLAEANDGAGASATDGCERLPRNSLAGAVALIDRGTCNFTVKTRNAQAAGAVVVVLINNVDGPPVPMTGSGGGFRIPTVMVSQADGTALRAQAGSTAIVREKVNPPLQVDSALDSDIVYHEYGHGLTWRMIGNMSGPLAGAIGEGASDTLAFLLNGDDRISEYSSSSAAGIRRDPYATYPRTYIDWAGASVHDDGEIYAAAMWRAGQLFREAGRTDDYTLGLFVDGMNFTPAGPAPEDMRDGMLAASTIASEDCLIWEAFAEYGIGVGADGQPRGKSVVVTESFEVPAECVAP